MIEEDRGKEAGYTGYEYREITVPEEYVSLCMDSYPCFGWDVDPNKSNPAAVRAVPVGKRDGKQEREALYFRRKRNLANKTELTRLQRNFDSCVAELEALKKSETTGPLMAALTVGLIGTAFMAGSTFAVTAESPLIWLSILLAVPGFLGWIFPYFIYQILVRRKTAEIEPLIEKKYDEINTICEKGSSLLY